MDSNGSPRTTSLRFKGKKSPLRSSCKPATAAAREGRRRKALWFKWVWKSDTCWAGELSRKNEEAQGVRKSILIFLPASQHTLLPKKTKKEKQMIVPKGCRIQWNVMVAHRGYSEGRGWEFWEGKVEYFINGKII